MGPIVKYDSLDSIIFKDDDVAIRTNWIVRKEWPSSLEVWSKIFFNTILSFSPYWDLKSFDDEYFCEK